MKFSRAEAFAPASMANVGVGFDILGLALDCSGDRVVAEWRAEPGITITRIEGDSGLLPLNPAKNTASVAAQSVLTTLGVTHGAALTLYKDLPLASGLGSSAASAVAGAVAVNALCGSPLSPAELLPACLDGEALVSGYHADNVAPSLLGGLILISGTDMSQLRQLPYPPHLRFALVTPDVAVPTAEARAVLPAMIPLKAMIAQTSALAQLIDALYRGDIPAMGAVMEQDGIIEPARAHLMPMMHDVRAAAKRAGAYGMVISGAGPTLCAVCDSDALSEAVAAAMLAVYIDAGISAVARSAQIAVSGAQVLGVS
ncbi:MAG: homoserine kinase [Armatimonadetes bacterium]|nr:homoserine kinase [Anaerolineae bacterium]